MIVDFIILEIIFLKLPYKMFNNDSICNFFLHFLTFNGFNLLVIMYSIHLYETMMV